MVISLYTIQNGYFKRHLSTEVIDRIDCLESCFVSQKIRTHGKRSQGKGKMNSQRVWEIFFFPCSDFFGTNSCRANCEYIQKLRCCAYCEEFESCSAHGHACAKAESLRGRRYYET